MIKKKAVKPKHKLPKYVATKYPPLTSENELKRTIKQQNALNRSRSKSMENRVAKVLGGRRVLMSGAAAAYKGDVEVRFKNNPSGYIVECKVGKSAKGRYARLTIEHNYKLFKLLIWSEEFSKFEKELTGCEKSLIIFNGSIRYDEKWARANQFTLKSNSDLIVLR